MLAEMLTIAVPRSNGASSIESTRVLTACTVLGGTDVEVALVVAFDLLSQQARADGTQGRTDDGDVDANRRAQPVTAFETTHGVQGEGDGLDGRGQGDGHGGQGQAAVLPAAGTLGGVGHGDQQAQAEVGDEGDQGVGLVADPLASVPSRCTQSRNGETLKTTMPAAARTSPALPAVRCCYVLTRFRT